MLCTATMACAADSLVENLIKGERETMRLVVQTSGPGLTRPLLVAQSSQ